ncbi:protein kinase [Stygiomarasmius scandens]|uniref:Protein kinase n=1 Tax=Marasmiellus scandens TaxID=2682957 RepID=A0ABR1JJC7_9AGAR
MSDEDFFMDNTPRIVDCDVLEAAKENVQPLASGRRVTALSSLLATPHARRESRLASIRHRLRLNVEIALEDEDDDPLEAYCALVYWTLENYPQGHSAESGLLELLEEATRILKDDRSGKWRGEMKYLKLWMLYASFVEKPVIIYRFLIANDIGTDFGILYEEFAAVLERDGRRKEADDIYALGIARRASPLDHLKSRYSEFQRRMMSAAPAAPVLQPETSTTRRAVLATTSAAAPLPGPSSRQTRPPSTTSNAPIPVFVDPTGEASQGSGMETNAWPDLGTRKTRIKENVPETKKLSGTKLKQAGKSKRLVSASSSSGSSFVPFTDPGPDDMPPPPVVPSKKAKSTSNSSSRGGFVPFVDEPLQKSSGSSKASFTPFVDEPSTSSKPSFVPFTDKQEGAPAVPSTPKFTPFCDEDASSATPATSNSTVPGSVMKLKTADLQSSTPSEAEALRKDPLKNYTS